MISFDGVVLEVIDIRSQSTEYRVQEYVCT